MSNEATTNTLLRENVDSSNISAYAYENGTLTVKFVTGSTYSFAGVSKQIAIDLDNAESKGRFFSENIRDEYDSVQLDVEAV